MSAVIVVTRQSRYDYYSRVMLSPLGPTRVTITEHFVSSRFRVRRHRIRSDMKIVIAMCPTSNRSSLYSRSDTLRRTDDMSHAHDVIIIIRPTRRYRVKRLKPKFPHRMN